MALVLIGVAVLLFVAIGCNDSAAVASRNLSDKADNFEIKRRVVFYNGITDAYILQVEGRCSIRKDNIDNQLEVMMKTGPNTFKKHILGLSDNVTYFSEQIDDAEVDDYSFTIRWRPQTLIPNVVVDVKK